MRGEKHDVEKKTNGGIGSIRATNLSHIAVIQDQEGNTVYLIKSTWWYSIITALFIIMLLITVLLTGAIYLNYMKVVHVEKQQDVQQQRDSKEDEQKGLRR